LPLAGPRPRSPSPAFCLAVGVPARPPGSACADFFPGTFVSFSDLHSPRRSNTTRESRSHTATSRAAYRVHRRRSSGRAAQSRDTHQQDACDDLARHIRTEQAPALSFPGSRAVLLAGVDDLPQKARHTEPLFLGLRRDGGQRSDFFRTRMTREIADLIEQLLQSPRGLDEAARPRAIR
jgi:hypothetical protein